MSRDFISRLICIHIRRAQIMQIKRKSLMSRRRNFHGYDFRTSSD